MRPTFALLVLLTAATVTGCETLGSGSRESDEQDLRQRREQIQLLLSSAACSGSAECRYTAFGSKPCGGPWEYLVYPATMDTVRFLAMVKAYNEREDAYNRTWGMMSDCMAVGPPDSVACIDGRCRAVAKPLP
ncbi:MAG: hypothetical protein F9K22_07610 [Bacteroidetes bacterium]|nr:MAG: hypothetical protein F9K22_07610 [Bacteroidota bacterium]